MGLLLLLVRLPAHLDTLLLVSSALSNLITGLDRLGMGILQLASLLVVVVLAILALLLLVGGFVRLIRAVGPRGGPRQPLP